MLYEPAIAMIRIIIGCSSWSLFVVSVYEFGFDWKIISGSALAGICGTLLAEPWRVFSKPES